MNIRFIVNPISGTRKKDDFPELVKQVIDTQRFDYQIVFTEYAGHAAEIARECAEKHVDICVAVGGDGTVNEVARSLVHTQTALAVVPCGSGNGLARHLCLPMDVKKSLSIINQAQIEEFDYGLINGMPFFCTCGMGFDAFISLKFSQAGKRGLATYVENVLKEGLRYKPETYVVDDETGTHSYKAFLIACANASQYGNNAYIAPGASMQDGLMDVIVMEPFGISGAAAIGYDMFAKTMDKNAKVKTFKARRLHIHREKPGAIHYDGDPVMTDADIDVELQPKGIRIVVNPNAIEDSAQPNPVLSTVTDFFRNLPYQ